MIVLLLTIKVLFLGCVHVQTQAPHHETRPVLVHNLVPVQIEEPGEVRHDHQVFFEAYDRFCELAGTDDVRATALEYLWNDHETDDALALARELESLVEDVAAGLKPFVSQDRFEPIPIYLVLGCGVSDGYALVADDDVWVFVDLVVLLHRGRDYWKQARFLLAHELGHAIHFSYQPDFAIESRHGHEEELWKTLLAEGIATHLSTQIYPLSDKEAFWGDILDSSEHEKWVRFAESERNDFGRRIKDYLEDPTTDPDVVADLLYVHDFDDLTRKRAGYYYGTQIVREYEQRHGSVLEAAYEDLVPYLLSYFDG